MLSTDAFSTVQMRLAAGLHPDPLGKLKRSPDLLATMGDGVLLLRGREGMGGKSKGKGRERKREADCLFFI